MIHIKAPQPDNSKQIDRVLYTIFPPPTHQFLEELSHDTKQRLYDLFSEQPNQTRQDTSPTKTPTTCSRDEAMQAIDTIIASMQNMDNPHKMDSAPSPAQAMDCNEARQKQDKNNPAGLLITTIEQALCFHNGQPTKTYTKHHIMTIINKHVTTIMNNLTTNNTIIPPTKGRFGTILVPFIHSVKNDVPILNYTVKFQSMIDYADIVLAILKYLNTFCEQSTSSSPALCNEPLLAWDNAYGKYEPDPRITIRGQRIRKRNIDELLQLILINNNHLTIRGRLWKMLGRRIFLTKEAWEKINRTTDIDLAGIRPCVPHYFTTLSKLYAHTQDQTIGYVLEIIKAGGYAGFIPLTYALKGNYDIHTTNAAISLINTELNSEQKKNFAITLFREAMKNKLGPFRGNIFAWLIR